MGRDIFFLGLRSLSGILFFSLIIPLLTLQQSIIISLIIQFVTSAKGLFDPGISQYILTRRVENIYRVPLLRAYILLALMGNIYFIFTANILVGVGSIYFQNIILSGILYNYYFNADKWQSRFYILWQILGFCIILLSAKNELFRYLLIFYSIPKILVIIQNQKVRLEKDTRVDLIRFARPLFIIAILTLVYGLSERVIFQLTGTEELNIPAQYINYSVAIMTLVFGHLVRVYVARKEELDEILRRFMPLLVMFPAAILSIIWYVNTFYFEYAVSYTLISVLFGSLLLSMFLLQNGYVAGVTKLIAKVQFVTMLASIALVISASLLGMTNLNLLFIKLLSLQLIQIIVYVVKLGLPEKRYSLLFLWQLTLALAIGICFDLL